ncbi:MAG: phosphoribosylaminoimidazolesuccinocarboxamide synthase, partial [Firmicutes bacterium]|nr:phosphoribosylaminoimidazolesuccinocarboxamide synthase [Bacillota bacterium]
MMIEATDRISAFDVILGSVIPDKGRILTKMSEFWFDLTKDLVPNHMITTDNDEMPEFFRDEYHRGRTMKCRKLEMLPIECVVRGYISGSGWASYCENGTVSGIKLPEGLRESDKLPEPIFTPTTKAALGLHDEHVSFLKCVEILEKLYPEKGSLYAAEIRELTLKLYEKCSEYALSRGIIIADTKFEFGLDEKGKVVLGDEMITPDSSRLWPLDTYAPGGPEFSFDKQYVRDWLKENPDSGYVLPEDVIEKTSEKYREAYKLLTGKDFDTAEACHG